MQRVLFISVLSLGLGLFLGPSGAASISEQDSPALDSLPISIGEDPVSDYRHAVSVFYQVPSAQVAQASQWGVPDAELPVLFQIAQKSHDRFEALLARRDRGDSWQQVASEAGLSPLDFTVHLGSSQPIGPDYRQAFEKLRHARRAEDTVIILDDSDIVHLVNLGFISRHWRYSQHLVMRWISEEHDFVSVHHRVMLFRQDMMRHPPRGHRRH